MKQGIKKHLNYNNLATLGLTLYIAGLSTGAFAEDATKGTEILTTSLTSLKSMLLGDARKAIDVCIVTAGAGGAVMAKNWGPVAMSAIALLGYELLCSSIK